MKKGHDHRLGYAQGHSERGIDGLTDELRAAVPAQRLPPSTLESFGLTADDLHPSRMPARFKKTTAADLPLPQRRR